VIIVADALHAQASHAREVATGGADLMVAVKVNQPTVHNRLNDLPWADAPIGHRRSDNGHRRSETRTVKALTDHTPGGTPQGIKCLRYKGSRWSASASSSSVILTARIFSSSVRNRSESNNMT
jgi:hypothetical protein